MKSENNLEELDMSFSEWSRVTLDDISTMHYGKMPKKDKIINKGYPIYSGYRIVGYYPEYMYPDSKLVVVARGVGGTGDVKLAPEYSYITNLSIVVNLNESIVDKKFMYYKLGNENLRILDSGSAQSQITINDLKRYSINLPSLNEQKAIADILSSLDDKIEVNNQMNETLEEMAQALFKRWFVDFEFPNEEGKPYKSSGGEMVESELGMIPKGWNIKKIIDISKQIGSGGTPSRKKVEYYGDEVLWLKTKELDDTYIFDTEEKITSIGLKESSAKIYPRNTIMIAMYGATVGKLGIISKELSFNQATCGIIVNDELPSHEYLFQWLKYNRDSIINLATGSAQQNLSVSVIKNIQLLCPNKNIVTLYKGLIEPIFKYKEKIQYENSSLKELRDTLLPKLMSGEIRVSDFES